MIVIEHPEKPLNRPLTDAQRDLLLAIVKTNGGGIHYYGAKPASIVGLVKRHLIQGKKGQPSCMVHTRAGLELARKLATPIVDAGKE